MKFFLILFSLLSLAFKVSPTQEIALSDGTYIQASELENGDSILGEDADGYLIEAQITDKIFHHDVVEFQANEIVYLKPSSFSKRISDRLKNHFKDTNLIQAAKETSKTLITEAFLGRMFWNSGINDINDPICLGEYYTAYHAAIGISHFSAVYLSQKYGYTLPTLSPTALMVAGAIQYALLPLSASHYCLSNPATLP
ncbi:MAG: hypothetical protein AB8C84_10035 [Oligoflexales bacterium]